MFRATAFLAALILAVAPAVAPAQAPEPIKLTLSPAALPSPTVKYRLLPERRNLANNNAAPHYYRSLAFFVDNKDLLNEVGDGVWAVWSRTPARELPTLDVRLKLGVIRPVLRQFERGARCRDCDWQLADRNALELLIPEVQGFRTLVYPLAVQARIELADGRFGEAAEGLQTGYAFCRHLGDGPTLIYVLVGAAMTQILDGTLEEMIQQPDAPNLYWSLTVLPRPFFDYQRPLREESTALERSFPFLKRLEGGPMTDADVEAARQEFHKTVERVGIVPATPAEVMMQPLAQAAAYPEARESLLKQGFTEAQLDAMPRFQVVGLDALRQYRAAWEEVAAWTNVPHFSHEPGYQKAQARMLEAGARMERVLLIGSALDRYLQLGRSLTLFDKIDNAAGRVDRRFAALRCVEAIRLYLANHDGKLPASLKDVTEVPIPVDPMTDLPFEYEVKGDTARLTAPAWPGEKLGPGYGLSYELTIRR
jgi:hypothetical protein